MAGLVVLFSILFGRGCCLLLISICVCLILCYCFFSLSENVALWELYLVLKVFAVNPM